MRFQSTLGKYRRRATFAVRLTIAAVLALVVAELADVRLPLWVVLTAIVVTQTSVGRSLKVTLDYFTGTLFGAIWGGMIAALIAHKSEAALILSLVLGLAPLAFAAALEPRFSAAPITAAIVILMPQITHATPVDSALERLLEVSLGALTGLIVSFVILPSSAVGIMREQTAQVLESMAAAANQLFSGAKRGLQQDEARELQREIGPRLNELSEVANEAERERIVRLSSDPSFGPLIRSLLRLRHDLVILGRASGVPLPAPLLETLEPAISNASTAITWHLRACAKALRERRAAPSLAEVENAIADFSVQVDAARQRHLFRDLSAAAVEYVFAIGFAVEQMRHDLLDLNRCIDQWAGGRPRS
jgi:uncharacterized membrane protein YccC